MMDVSCTSDGSDPYVVAVAGDIDIATVGRLEAPLIDAVAAGREPLLLDLSSCAFIDSTGIRLLLRAYQLLRRDEGGPSRFVVVAQPYVAELLRQTMLDKLIPVVATRREATQHFGDGGVARSSRSGSAA